MENKIKKKRYKKKLLFFGIFIIISCTIILGWYYTNKEVNNFKDINSDNLEAELEKAEYLVTDGLNSSTLSTTCSTPTTILSVPTTYSASPNILIAFVQAWSTDTGAEAINQNGIILKSGTTNTMLVNNSNWQMGVGVSGGTTSFGHFIFNHSAPANEVYNITACSGATAVVMEAKLVILNNVSNFTSNYTIGNASGTYNNLSTLSTTFSTGKNVILTAVHISANSATSPRVTVNLINNSGAILNSMLRPVNLTVSSATGANSTSVFLMAYEPSAPANAKYFIEVNNTGGDYYYQIESVVFQVANAYINTSSTQSLTTGLFNFTTLANVNLSRNYTFLATGDFVDLDSSTELLNTFEFITNAGVGLNGTENAIVPVGVTDGAGAGITGAIMMERRTNDPTLNTFYLRTNLSATTWSAKGTMLAFSLEDNPVGGANPCAYSGTGNYNPPCNCAITSNIVIQSGSNVTIPGTSPVNGSFTLTANLTGYKNIQYGVVGGACNITIRGITQNG